MPCIFFFEVTKNIVKDQRLAGQNIKYYCKANQSEFLLIGRGRFDSRVAKHWQNLRGKICHPIQIQLI